MKPFLITGRFFEDALHPFARSVEDDLDKLQAATYAARSDANVSITSCVAEVGDDCDWWPYHFESETFRIELYLAADDTDAGGNWQWNGQMRVFGFGSKTDATSFLTHFKVSSGAVELEVA